MTRLTPSRAVELAKKAGAASAFAAYEDANSICLQFEIVTRSVFTHIFPTISPATDVRQVIRSKIGRAA